MYNIRYIKQIIFNKYATNLKTIISQRSLRNLGVLLLIFEFNNFSILIDIINNNIYTFGPCHQNSSQWQCSIVMCLCLYHVTSIVHCYWREFWYNFDTVLCQFLKTGKPVRCLMDIVQLLKFSGICPYPLSFFLSSPFTINNPTCTYR